METNGPEPHERMQALQQPLDNDRFDNDDIDARQAPGSDPRDYEERLERSRKHAAWRTEMLKRDGVNGRSRPDSTF